jgi:hypothetical protein
LRLGVDFRGDRRADKREAAPVEERNEVRAGEADDVLGGVCSGPGVDTVGAVEFVGE